ncbi:hypothetical protein GPN2_10681 [Streptomyces murinus]
MAPGHVLDVHQGPLLNPRGIHELRGPLSDVRREPRGGQRDGAVLVVGHPPPVHGPTVLDQPQRLGDVVRRIEPAGRRDDRVLTGRVDLPCLAGPSVQLACAPVHFQASDVRARSLPLLDQSLMAQRFERAGCGRPGHLPVRRQLSLRGNLVAWSQVPAKDLIADEVRDLEILRQGLFNLRHAPSSSKWLWPLTTIG